MIIHEPNAIEARSMEIIESELPFPIPEENKAVVMRVIHCTADFDSCNKAPFRQHFTIILFRKRRGKGAGGVEAGLPHCDRYADGEGRYQ